MGGEVLGGGSEEGLELGMFRCLDQAEMALRQGQGGIVGHTTKNRQLRQGCGRGLTQDIGMPGAAHIIEDHARHLHIIAMGGESPHHRGRRGPLVARIHH